ncbi:hypothetical protein AQI96_29260 [Streptomyces canus]|nr:hypothetical protein AQI96_29260 [Streptomyces canus]
MTFMADLLSAHGRTAPSPVCAHGKSRRGLSSTRRERGAGGGCGGRRGVPGWLRSRMLAKPTELMERFEPVVLVMSLM